MVFQVSRLVQATFIVGKLVYLLCYGFVLIAPELAWQMTGHMLHTDLSGSTWSTSIEGFFMGWVCGGLDVPDHGLLGQNIQRAGRRVIAGIDAFSLHAQQARVDRGDDRAQ